MLRSCRSVGIFLMWKLIVGMWKSVTETVCPFLIVFLVLERTKFHFLSSYFPFLQQRTEGEVRGTSEQ